MHWIILFVAGIMETIWASGLKYTEGMTRLWPTVGTLAAMAISVWLLSVAMKTLPMGTAYAIWTGIGAVGAVIAGIVFFGEPLTWERAVCLALIISGLAGLKLVSGH